MDLSRKLLAASSFAVVAWAGIGAGQAAPCATAPVSTYTVTGFTCSVGTVLFSDIVVTTTTSGNGTVSLGDFAPQTVGAESGLALTFSAAAGPSPPVSTADVSWLYTVSALTGSLNDASLSVTGSTRGTGVVSLDETLSNGTTLHASIPGSATDSTTFAPIVSLSVGKDLGNATGSDGFATSSIMTNLFSTSSHVVTSEPASLALLGVGLVGLGLSRRARRKSDV